MRLDVHLVSLSVSLSDSPAQAALHQTGWPACLVLPCLRNTSSIQHSDNGSLQMFEYQHICLPNLITWAQRHMQNELQVRLNHVGSCASLLMQQTTHAVAFKAASQPACQET